MGTASSPGAPLLKMSDIVKRFPGVKVLDGIDLEAWAGDVHRSMPAATKSLT